VQNDVTIRLNGSIERSYKWTNHERTMATEQNPHPVPHEIVERSNVLVWPLHGQMLSELLILECISNSRFRVLRLKKTGFLIVENTQKSGFRIRENPGWKH